MIVKHKTIPAISVLKNDEKTFHYIDSYQSNYLHLKNNDIENLTKIFLTIGPKWMDVLLSLRHQIARLLKLKTGHLTNEQRNTANFKFEPGEQLDLFKLYTKTPNEIILGEDDRHLDFRVSILLDSTNETNHPQSTLHVTTAVQFNNWLGRFYFIIVKPFHQLIVKSTLQEMTQKLSTEEFTYKT